MTWVKDRRIAGASQYRIDAAGVDAILETEAGGDAPAGIFSCREVFDGYLEMRVRMR